MALVIRACFFTLLLYLLATSFKLKKTQALEDIILRKITNARKHRFLNNIDLLIKASAIDKILPFFNLYIFVVVSFAFIMFACLSAYYLTRSIVPTLGIGVIAGLMPKLILELLRIVNVRRVRHNYHGFLCSLIGFYSLSKNIVGSYKNAASYTGEPLRSYVQDEVYKYEKSNVNFNDCLDELAARTGERELGKLIKFTKLFLTHGGDFTKILEKLNSYSQRVEKARLSFYSSAYVGIIAIGIMVVIDFVTFILLFINESTASSVLSTTLMGNGFVLLNLASVLVAIYMSFRLFRGDV